MCVYIYIYMYSIFGYFEPCGFESPFEVACYIRARRLFSLGPWWSLSCGRLFSIRAKFNTPCKGNILESVPFKVLLGLIQGLLTLAHILLWKVVAGPLKCPK